MKASHPTTYFIEISCRDYRAKERRVFKINSENTFAVNHGVLFNTESIDIILNLGFFMRGRD